MSVRRWAFQDLVLAAVCVAAITLGLWPNEPTRQMIHSRNEAGNTSSYSLSTDDSRLARLSRELGRRQNPRPTREISLVKWRMDLAHHYSRRLAQEAGIDTQSKNGSDSRDSESPKFVPRSAGKTPIVQVGFTTSENGTDSVVAGETETTAETREAETREFAFWNSVSAKSELALSNANRQLQEQLAKVAPPKVVLGEVFQPAKSANAWITAILLGLLASCVFADWSMRSPAITISRNEATPDSHSATGASPNASSQLPGSLRMQIPVEWIRIHQPISVQARRLALASLVVTAIVTNLDAF